MKRLILLSALFLAGCTQPAQLYDGQADVLFDAAHGQTAGEADWVIDGAFSSFNDVIRDMDYKTVSTEYDTTLTYEKLKQYKAVIIPEPNIPFKVEEQEAIERFVGEGGSIMMIADHYNADRNLNRFDSSEIFNGYRRGAFDDITKGLSHDEKQSERMEDVKSSDFLSDTFGVRFRYNALNNVRIDVDPAHDAFGLLNNVKSVNMHAGSTIAITNPKIAKGIIYPDKLSQKDRWPHAVDQGVYTNGGTDEGAFVAISKYKKGKAVFIGDSSIVEDETPKYVREDNGNSKETYDGIGEESHKTLLKNLVAWMMQPEDYTTLEGKAKPDQKTPLLSMEIPQQSMEPKHEPWGQPGHGYLWYDPSTFEQGSFGADSNKRVEHKSVTTEDGPLEILAPSSIKPGDYIKIDIYSQKQLEDVAIELIDSDGEQVGLFNGRPPGKSNTYDMKAKDNRFHCYFNGKIAREASQSVAVKVYSKGQMIDSKRIDINS
ncbi:MAG: DNA-binding protein [Macrococcus canis]|uniref:DNA-binding protein n=1 Tax=Macrococcoides canis TaxID=1855823 RepID=A0A4R6C5K8_9STAP|nr:DNA-binding protein [Macrococcus canis]MEE1106440.1 DNA-binding protein [Macrococcus canis]TDM17292.1 DNA-binding protein [Macrococcus canis]TDM36442.1 DNA-binding protein [Macrococcus canis]